MGEKDDLPEKRSSFKNSTQTEEAPGDEEPQPDSHL
jgi:hypothetical protein